VCNLDATIPVPDADNSQIMSITTSATSVSSRISPVFFGVLSLALASIGVYGVITYV